MNDPGSSSRVREEVGGVLGRTGREHPQDPVTLLGDRQSEADGASLREQLRERGAGPVGEIATEDRRRVEAQALDPWNVKMREALREIAAQHCRTCVSAEMAREGLRPPPEREDR